MSRNVLVIAAHPDDEILGCGGTLALHADRKDCVMAFIACEGESLRYGIKGVGQTEQMRRAAEIIGINELRCGGFADQRLDTLTLTEVMRPIEQIIAEWQPAIVYCQYGGDVNRDHQLLFQALLVATRPTQPCIETILAFDTASSTEWAYPRSFVPDTWVDISQTMDRKLAAIQCYTSEIKEYPHPRSVEALRYKAHAWGNQVCIASAEVFMTIRRIIRHDKFSL